MMQDIFFYKVNDPYGVFSNFYNAGFYVDDVSWRTVEHYFQAQKFNDDLIKEKIRTLISPMEAAVQGRDRSLILRADWDMVKDDIMRFAVMQKFKQNLDARAILLSTGDCRLIEHTKNDSYWADGGDGTGGNKLGIILMETRAFLSKNV